MIAHSEDHTAMARLQGWIQPAVAERNPTSAVASFWKHTKRCTQECALARAQREGVGTCLAISRAKHNITWMDWEPERLQPLGKEVFRTSRKLASGLGPGVLSSESFQRLFSLRPRVSY